MLDRRERAALVKACAVLGGIEDRSIRTVARRLDVAVSKREQSMKQTGGEVEVEVRMRIGWGGGVEGGRGTHSSTRALAMNESTMRLL